MASSYLVTKTGSKLGRYAYNFDAKQKLLAIGQHPAWLFCGLSARFVFFPQPWSDPQSEIGIGAAEAEQNSRDESSDLFARMNVRSRRA